MDRQGQGRLAGSEATNGNDRWLRTAEQLAAIEDVDQLVVTPTGVCSQVGYAMQRVWGFEGRKRASLVGQTPDRFPVTFVVDGSTLVGVAQKMPALDSVVREIFSRQREGLDEVGPEIAGFPERGFPFCPFGELGSDTPRTPWNWDLHLDVLEMQAERTIELFRRFDSALVPGDVGVYPPGGFFALDALERLGRPAYSVLPGVHVPASMSENPVFMPYGFPALIRQQRFGSVGTPRAFAQAILARANEKGWHSMIVGFEGIHLGIGVPFCLRSQQPTLEEGTRNLREVCHYLKTLGAEVVNVGAIAGEENEAWYSTRYMSYSTFLRQVSGSTVDEHLVGRHVATGLLPDGMLGYSSTASASKLEPRNTALRELWEDIRLMRIKISEAKAAENETATQEKQLEQIIFLAALASGAIFRRPSYALSPHFWSIHGAANFALRGMFSANTTS